jgi:hypothetical protein
MRIKNAYFLSKLFQKTVGLTTCFTTVLEPEITLGLLKSEAVFSTSIAAFLIFLIWGVVPTELILRKVSMNFQDLQVTSFYLFFSLVASPQWEMRNVSLSSSLMMTMTMMSIMDACFAPMIFVKMDSFHHFGLYQHRTLRVISSLSATSVLLCRRTDSDMYRAYACGVGLPQRHDEMHWQKFLKDSHYRRMREMKPAIDNKVNPQMSTQSI